jgi:hypothetical protein
MLGKLTRRTLATLTAVLLSLLSAPDALSQARRVPDTFTATTANMSPAGVMLKIDVVKWSNDQARAAVISILSGDAEDTSLTDLPTMGYVWANGSGAGYALKYAHRQPTPDNGERITFVTDKSVGAYDFAEWTAANQPDASAAGYSVIELYLDAEGHGVGTMSLAAEVVFDGDSKTVSLTGADAASNVLADAVRQPRPYWAQDER